MVVLTGNPRAHAIANRVQILFQRLPIAATVAA